MSIGIWQLLLIVVIIFVIFGAGKLPSVMHDLGKGVRNLKKGLSEADENTVIEKEKSLKEVEPLVGVTKKDAAKASSKKKG